MSFSKWTAIINKTIGKNNIYITSSVCAFLNAIGDLSRDSIFKSKKR